MNRLESLCRPLVRLLCETWCFGRSGAPVSPEPLRRKIQNSLNDIRSQCESDPVLKRDFSRMERPLIFFADYTIKEGNFPFSRDWRELARDYNELSGDEKFFDLLAETLDDPDASEHLMMFFLFMGLGFDGCYRGDADYIERRMKLCAARTSVGRDLRREEHSLFTPAPVRPAGGRRFRPLFLILIAACTFTVAALIVNYCVFRMTSDEFRTTLLDAVEMVRPAYSRSNQELVVNPNTSEVKHE